MNRTLQAPALDWESLRASLWEPLRRPRRVTDKVLMADTRRWLAQLPRGVRPVELPNRFARIANELSRLGAEPAALSAYLEDLLVDHRGDRQGFPALVHEELRALYLHALRQAVTQREAAMA